MIFNDTSRDRLDAESAVEKDATPFVTVANLHNLIGGSWAYV